MDVLAEGAELDAGDLAAPGAAGGSPIRIRAPLTELPHGVCYRARQDGVALLVTVFDPVFSADLGVYAGLRRDLEAAGGRIHRGLLPLYGFGRAGRWMLMLEHDPGGTSFRTFIEHRLARGRPLDAEAAFTLIGHLCNALTALHPEVIHGYVTPDTTYVSESGRVFLSTAALGRWLSRTPGFARHRQAGRLSNIPPEQLLASPKLTPGTDIFALAALFMEMVTGRALAEAGQPIHTLGLVGPPDLLMCLERATAPSPSARPPDVATFKDELAEALREGPLQRHGPASAPIPPPPRAMLPSAGPPPAPPRSIPPPPPAPPRRAPPPPPASASSSMLGLSLEDMDLAAQRLETLDGLPGGIHHVGDDIAPAGPGERPKADADSGLNTAQPGRAYFLVRGVAIEGPMPFSDLTTRAADGLLSMDDVVQDRTSGAEQRVATIAGLRRLLETADERAELRRFAKQRAAPRTGPRPALPPRAPRDRRGLYTALWVVLALGAFAGAALWLIQRSG